MGMGEMAPPPKEAGEKGFVNDRCEVSLGVFTCDCGVASSEIDVRS